MEHACRRRSGVWAKVRLLLALVSVLVSGKPARAAEWFEVQGGEGEATAVVYPAELAGSRGVTVVLHGMCGEPLNTCKHFAAQVTSSQHLICPRATRRCDGGGASWQAHGFEQQIERALARAEAALGARVDTARGRTLIGYSLGAYRALEVAQRGTGKYPRLMLIGARIAADAKLLRERGVGRVLLSAGSWDMTYDPMQRETERLRRHGLSARFLGLGPVGHQFTPRFAEYLPQALTWLETGDNG
jgi:predicted esterase